jgi:hypothetical protein
VELVSSLTPVDRLERGLIHGGSRWIADLTEFFRDYRVDDTTFALYAKGKTRSSGFFLSRFAAWTILPNYTVGLFSVNEGDGVLSTEKLRKRMDLVNKISEREGLHWAWLVLLSDRNVAPAVLSYVSRYDKKELGVAVGSTSSGQIVLSDNQIGKSIGKQLGLNKALGVGKSRRD